MSEPEDVLIDAAEHATEAAVALWRRRSSEAAEGTLRIDSEAAEFFEDWTLTEQPSGDAVKAPINAVPVSVGARDFRVFAISRK